MNEVYLVYKDDEVKLVCSTYKKAELFVKTAYPEYKRDSMAHNFWYIGRVDSMTPHCVRVVEMDVL